MRFHVACFRPFRLVVLACGFAAAQAGAQTLAQAAPAAPAAQADAIAGAQRAALQASSELYQVFGEQTGLLALSTDLVDRASSDPRIASFFEKTNRAALARQLADQFCQVLGGPCRHGGADMKTAHQDMGVNKADFHALVEDLQAATPTSVVATLNFTPRQRR